MTLKEELSLSRRNAIAVKAELDAQADEEMRKMIYEYIGPILRLIHESHPCQKSLAIRVEDHHNSISFKPMSHIKSNMYEKHYASYRSKLPTYQLFSASLRVGTEFDLDVQQATDSDRAYIFTMTLDD